MADTGALEALVARLEKVASLLEGRLDAQAAKKFEVSSRSIADPVKESLKDLPIDDGISPSVAAFDELLEVKLGRISAVAEKIGGSVLQSTAVLKDAFSEERKLVLAISQCKKPKDAELQKAVEPLGNAITKAHKLLEGKRTDAFHHQKVVAESLSTLSWVVYTGKDCGLALPGPHVEESWQAAEFYNNKILVEFKTKDPNHVEWAKAVKDLYIPGLRDYVKKFHTVGPAWNANGGDVLQFDPTGKQKSVSTESSRKAPPPPPPKGPPAPPPPPGPGAVSSGPPAVPAATSMSAVFQEISKGEAVTAGLKKVTDDMKTKNRSDRSGAVPAGVRTATAGSPAVPVKAVVKKPVFELQLGRKWVVEHQVGNRSLVIEDTSARQSVYIFGCKDSVIQVKGKVNNITVDKCTKTALVFSDVVAAFEVVNCTSVEVQCQGTAPTISIDNTNGCHLYLSSSSLNSVITTAKSSEVNVAVPGATPKEDLVEHALPEQFLHAFQDGQFVTTPVCHSGG